MKILLYILGLTLSQSIFGQIVYKPTFIDQCTNKPIKRVMWWVSDSIQNYGNDYYGMDHAKLPKTGKYMLNCSSISQAPINITINDHETVKDTFFLRRLNAMLTIKSRNSNSNTPNIPPKYFVCNIDSLANGKVIDYYRNEKKRMEGTFQNGKLIDTLHTYYRSGELYELMIPNKKWYKIIRYSIDGQIIEE